MKAYTDEALMAMVRDGDVARLGLLFERHQRRIYSFIHRLIGDPSQSEDLVQEVFFRLLEYRASYRDEVPFLPWFFRIARNVCNDHFRADKGREQPAEEGDESWETPDPMGDLCHQWDLATLEKAFAALPSEKREVLLLSRFEGLKYQQIAEMSGVSVAAIKVRVHRALEELRTRFRELWQEQAS